MEHTSTQAAYAPIVVAQPQHRASRLTAALICVTGIVAAVGLFALGTWQIHRLSWKTELIARVEARIHQAAADPPEIRTWTAQAAAEHEYRRVQAVGYFDFDRETLVSASTELGPGYWVMTPMRMADGASLLVNRGFVPSQLRSTVTLEHGDMTGPRVVTGLIRGPEPNCALFRANDPTTDRWCSRDAAGIAAARGVELYAAYFVDAGASGGGYPIGGLTRVAFSNNHLVYALTWYALGLMAICLSVRVGLPSRWRNSAER